MSYEFQSGFASHISGMLEQRLILGYSTERTKKRFKNFDRFCLNNFPNKTTLTQEIAFAWCNNAKGKEGSKRASVIRSFGRYLLSVGEEAYIIPSLFFPASKATLPYICTDSELRNFFDATDRIPSDRRNPLLEYTIPVIFRLQYSCGMRPQEVRNLRRTDINFYNSTIYIADGKHYKDRRLTADEYIMEMCRKYDRIAESLIPSRTHFFQSPLGRAYSSGWLSSIFSKCWMLSGNGDKRNNCVPYSLRHRYATETLMRWLEEGRDIDAWIPYLSAYMGHASFSSTCYYTHLLPERLACMGYVRTNHIIPKANYEKDI
jgi:integrase